MVSPSPSIVLWVGGAANQRALAAKVAEQYKIAGIVIDEKVGKKGKKRTVSLFSRVINYIRFRRIYSSWKELLNDYNFRYHYWPNVPIKRVNAINSNEAYEFTKSLNPELIIVSGTGLVKGPLLELQPSIGIINLHTGLSPYVKGGPNCTNWCIANNDWHLTGNTIMWLNAGIDSGNIIASEYVDIRQASSLYEAQRLVMEHAHALYLKAIAYLIAARPPYQSVLQDSLGPGRLFLTRMWTPLEMAKLLKNWKGRQSAKVVSTPGTVQIPDLN